MKPSKKNRVQKNTTAGICAEPFSLAGNDFDEFEKAAKLKFNADHRSRIEKAALQYANDRNNYDRLAEAEEHRVVGERRFLDALARSLRRSNDQIGGIKQQHPRLWKRLFGPELSPCRGGARFLEDLQKRCEELRRRRKHAPPEYPIIWKFLRTLERIFKDAGGTTTGIHRGRATRHGPFPDFANAVVRKLPPSIRPGSVKFLWEKYFARRKKGDSYQISVSHPERFSLLITSRKRGTGQSSE